MLKSILGSKIGMTQIFDQCNLVPVTVISAGPCIVTAVRTAEKDGYTAVQVGFGSIKEKSVNKPLAGQFKKANVAPQKFVREFRTGDVSSYQVGQELKVVDIFKPGDFVDVCGVSKGKGFAGVMKRHNFGGGPATHGQSDRQRAPGAIGSQRPQRVLRGLRMAGHLGNENITIQKLKVVAVDPEKNLLMIKGAVPGVKHGLLVIEGTVKKVTVHAQAKAPAAGGKKKEAPAKGKK
jgi:large subunit ribosomal protein L3